MILEEELVKEFIRVVDLFYPPTGKVLHHCHVKVIKSYWGRPPKELQYLGIYCPESIISAVRAHKDELREVAHAMGLAEVVCMNATRLLRDPISKFKLVDPRFWLELHWIVTKDQQTPADT